MSSLFKILKGVISGVKKKNFEDPNVETAPSSVFDKMKEKVEEIQNNTNTVETTESSTAGTSIFDVLKEKMDTVQKENEADENEATADSSVFADLQRQIEELKAQQSQMQEQSQATASVNEAPSIPTPAPTPEPTPTPEPSTASSTGMMAMTNSGGGSLAIRQHPDMGAAHLDVRIPEMSLLKVLEYSDKSVHIDGVIARWCKVDFQGTQGWILEHYLNFN